MSFRSENTIDFAFGRKSGKYLMRHLMHNKFFHESDFSHYEDEKFLYQKTNVE